MDTTRHDKVFKTSSPRTGRELDAMAGGGGNTGGGGGNVDISGKLDKTIWDEAFDIIGEEGNRRIKAKLSLFSLSELTAYGTDETPVPTLWDSLPIAAYTSKGVAQFSGDYFTVVNGVVSLRNDLNFGGGFDENQLKQYLSTNNYLNGNNYSTIIDKYVLKTGDTITGELNVAGSIHCNNSYFYADKGWFQCSIMNTGLYNLEADTRFFPVAAKVWASDSNIRLSSGMSYQFANAATKLSLGYLNSVNITTEYGDVNIGPMNEEFCHFQTERPQFYMNKPLCVDGEIYSGTGYNNLVLSTANSASYWSMCEKIPGRYHELDLTGLDESLYYPCVCYVQSRNLETIQITAVLNNKAWPGWGTHNAGFTFELIVEVNGAGWGTIGTYNRVLKAEYGWATGTPCAGYTVTWKTNNFIVWLRGGGKYDVYKTDNTPMSVFGQFNDGYDNYGVYNCDQAAARWGNIWANGGGNIGLGNVIATGEVTAFSTSDKRLKKEVEDLAYNKATQIIMNTRPVTYKWNDKAFELNPYDRYKGRECGLIAQELADVLPCAIKPVFQEYLSIDYTRLIPPVITVIKEHESEFNKLKRRIKELEKEVEQLKQK